MKFQLPIHIPALPQPIAYTDKIMLIGSCFTEHIAGRLATYKFSTLQNPHGILFNPLSVARNLGSYYLGMEYTEDSLFYLNELWNSWDHHTSFSHINKAAALKGINASQRRATAFLKEADWLVITLGSAFQYHLTDAAETAGAGGAGFFVANNHRAPAAWFEKRLLDIDHIVDRMCKTLAGVLRYNPKVQIVFTISPVRHIRDGVVENNRSKARLIEAVHQICNRNELFKSNCHYFPAYELVIDVLRDYRFYDIDMVHPNYAATEYVWEAFTASCIAPEALPLMEQVKEIVTAKNHRPRFPETEAHKRFLKTYADKARTLAAAYPFLNLADEVAYFDAAR